LSGGRTDLALIVRELPTFTQTTKSTATRPTATAYGQTVTCAATVSAAAWMRAGPVQSRTGVTNFGSPVILGAPTVRTSLLTAGPPHSDISQLATCDGSALTSVATVMFGKKSQASRHRKRLRMLRSMWPEQIGGMAMRPEVWRTNVA
jgi:hypothetical protein